MKISRWVVAMNKKVESLNDNHEFLDFPNDDSAIGIKWMYKLKRHVDGSIEQFKERLVAKGFTKLKVWII